jgi:hypothetical protein
MRLIFAWIGGIATFIVLTRVFDWIGDSIGVPVQLDLGYTRYWSDRYGEYETDSQFTNYGICTVLITWMLAIRVGMTINANAIDAGVGQEGNLQFVCWLIGLSILVILLALLRLALQDFHSYLSGFINVVLQFSIVAGVWWAVKTFYDQRLERMRSTK